MFPADRRRSQHDALATAQSALRPTKSVRICSENVRLNQESTGRDDVVHGAAWENPLHQYRSHIQERPRIRIDGHKIIIDVQQSRKKEPEIEEGEIVEENNSEDDIVQPQGEIVEENNSEEDVVKPQEKVKAEVLLPERSSSATAARTCRPSSSNSSVQNKHPRLQFRSPDAAETNELNKRRMLDVIVPSPSLERSQLSRVPASNHSFLDTTQGATADDDSGSEENYGYYFCYCCGKDDFPSEKSLSGHMRSHPERSWRGIRPPVGVDAPFRWMEKNIINKGTGCEIKPSSPPPTLGTPPIANVITNSKRRTSVRASSNEREVINSLLMLQNAHNESEELNNNDKKDKLYPCNQCNKVFSCYQALGGHTASHNRGKTFGEDPTFSSSDTNTADFISPSLPIASPVYADSNDVMMEPREYNCDMCPESFPSEDTLGGHLNTCHPSSRTKISKSSGHLLDFDLNELPLVENEEI